MRFEQTKDILDHARTFHKYLAEYYHRLSEKRNKDRCQLFLDYFEEHEKHLEQIVLQLEDTTNEKILKTWFKSSPCDEIFAKLQQFLKESSSSIDSLCALALHVDDCLINMYKSLAEKAETGKVRDLFTELAQLEENEKRNLARTIILGADL